MSYLEHFRELRNRLIYCFIFLFICFFIYFYNAQYLGSLLSKPLYNLIGDSEQKRMIFTGLPEVFISYLKIALFASVLTSFPFFILQFSLFISPALYKKEKNFFIPMFFFFLVFFFTGVLFGVFSFLFRFRKPIIIFQ